MCRHTYIYFLTTYIYIYIYWFLLAPIWLMQPDVAGARRGARMRSQERGDMRCQDEPGSRSQERGDKRR